MDVGQSTERVGRNRLLTLLFAVSVFAFVALTIGALLFLYLFYHTRGPQGTVTVTGSAKERVKSDVAVWNSSFSVRTDERQLPNAFKLMKGHEETVLEAFKEYGIKDSEFSISPVSVEEQYQQNYEPFYKTYALVQYVFVETRDVDGIDEKVKRITQKLLEKGLVFQSRPVEYYYSKLPELRVSLLSRAMEDARARAEQIAKSAKLSLGKLLNVRSGVVQVLAPNSAEVSDYGTYDVRTLEKDVMVTVNATYKLR